MTGVQATNIVIDYTYQYNICFTCNANTSKTEEKTKTIAITQPDSGLELTFEVTQKTKKLEAIDYVSVTSVTSGSNINFYLKSTHPSKTISVN